MGGRPVRGHRGRHVRARHVGAAAGARHRRMPTTRSRSAGHRRERLLSSSGPRRPQPARDDKVVAEWNGLAITALAHYPRSPTRWPDPAHARGPADATRCAAAVEAGELLLAYPPGRRPAAPGLPRTAWWVTPAGCSPTTAASPTRSRRCTRSPATVGWLRARRRPAGHRAGAVRRRHRRLLRHRRRRRGAGHPAGRPDRRRHAVGQLRDHARRWSRYTALTGEHPLPRGGRGGAGPDRCRSSREHPGSPGWPPRSARRCSPGRSRSRWSATDADRDALAARRSGWHRRAR